MIHRGRENACADAPACHRAVPDPAPTCTTMVLLRASRRTDTGLAHAPFGCFFTHACFPHSDAGGWPPQRMTICAAGFAGARIVQLAGGFSPSNQTLLQAVAILLIVRHLKVLRNALPSSCTSNSKLVFARHKARAYGRMRTAWLRMQAPPAPVYFKKHCSAPDQPQNSGGLASAHAHSSASAHRAIRENANPQFALALEVAVATRLASIWRDSIKPVPKPAGHTRQKPQNYRQLPRPSAKACALSCTSHG